MAYWLGFYDLASDQLQPILNVLDYRPSSLELVPDVVIVEGKYDYYTLRYAMHHLSGAPEIRLMPGMGAGNLATLISLYVSWGAPFILLFDSDREGDRQRTRYRDDYGSDVKDKLFLLDDADPKWTGKRMEDLFNLGDRKAIQAEFRPDLTDYNKTAFNQSLQELVATERTVKLGPKTEERLEKLVSFLSGSLQAIGRSVHSKQRNRRRSHTRVVGRSS